MAERRKKSTGRTGRGSDSKHKSRIHLELQKYPIALRPIRGEMFIAISRFLDLALR